MDYVEIKAIQSERFADAPFVGALISAKGCSKNCKGCFNQHLKELTSVFMTPKDVLNQVQRNPLHEGIILGGLEWTEQPEDLERLVTTALSRGLQVMIQTSMTQEVFTKAFPVLVDLPIWVKFGDYREDLFQVLDPSGIYLASSNQYVMFMGGEELE